MIYPFLLSTVSALGHTGLYSMNFTNYCHTLWTAPGNLAVSFYRWGTNKFRVMMGRIRLRLCLKAWPIDPPFVYSTELQARSWVTYLLFTLLGFCSGGSSSLSLPSALLGYAGSLPVSGPEDSFNSKERDYSVSSLRPGNFSIISKDIIIAMPGKIKGFMI